MRHTGGIAWKAMAGIDSALWDIRGKVLNAPVFELPETRVEAATPVIRQVMAEAALPAVELSVPLGVDIGTGMSWDAAH